MADAEPHYADPTDRPSQWTRIGQETWHRSWRDVAELVVTYIPHGCRVEVSAWDGSWAMPVEDHVELPLSASGERRAIVLADAYLGMADEPHLDRYEVSFADGSDVVRFHGVSHQITDDEVVVALNSLGDKLTWKRSAMLGLDMCCSLDVLVPGPNG